MLEPEVPRSPPLRIELRGTRLWHPGLMAFITASGMLAELAIARFWLRLDSSPFLDRVLLVSLALAPISLAAALVLRPRSRDAIELSAEHLEIPAYRGSRRRRRTRLRDVYSIQTLRWIFPGILALGVRGRLVSRVPLHWLASPADAARLEAGIRDRIASLPDGADRLRRIDHCRSVWQAAGRGVPWITLGLSAALVGAFLFEVWVGATTEKLLLLMLGGLAPALVVDGDLDRLLTAAFLHSSILHLVVNLTGLIAFGVVFERLLGWPRFLFVLSVAQVAGTALFVAWPSAVGAVGASAALHGIVACWLFLNVARREELPVFLRSPTWNLMLLLGLAVWTEVEFSNLAHAAHLGGFAGGLAASAAVVRVPLDGLRPHRPRWLLAVSTAWILVWVGALSVGIHRAWGPIEERTLDTTRRLLAAPGAPAYAYQEVAAELASLEWTRSRREGPILLGAGAARGAHVGIGLAQDAPRAVVVDLGDASLAESLTLHAVALEGESLAGLLEVKLGPGSQRLHRWADPALERLSASARLELTLLDARWDAEPGRAEFSFWALDPEEAQRRGRPAPFSPTPPPSGGRRSSRAPRRGPAPPGPGRAHLRAGR